MNLTTVASFGVGVVAGWVARLVYDKYFKEDVQNEILIDNGHGSNTSGKCSPDGRLKEYAYTREIAIRWKPNCANKALMPNVSSKRK